MPSGDAQRTWFPEMVVQLRAEWHAGMSMPALIGLRDELDGALQRIRAGRNIQTPIVTCSKCGLTGPAAERRRGPVLRHMNITQSLVDQSVCGLMDADVFYISLHS
jgi:hypothetical protein